MCALALTTESIEFSNAVLMALHDDDGSWLSIYLVITDVYVCVCLCMRVYGDGNAINAILSKR